MDENAQGVAREWRMSHEMWERIAPLLPKLRRHPKGDRPWIDHRKIAEGIFCVLRSGCQWKAVPHEFGSGSTLHRRFQQWVQRGVFRRLWQAGLMEYDALKGIRWERQALDGAMTKAPLSGGKMREKPDRSGQERYQAFLATPAYLMEQRSFYEAVLRERTRSTGEELLRLPHGTTAHLSNLISGPVPVLFPRIDMHTLKAANADGPGAALVPFPVPGFRSSTTNGVSLFCEMGCALS